LSVYFETVVVSALLTSKLQLNHFDLIEKLFEIEIQSFSALSKVLERFFFLNKTHNNPFFFNGFKPCKWFKLNPLIAFEKAVFCVDFGP
jgi:hypothetical protein